MKILFTGASSFTGYWFVKELAEAGHEVTATLRHAACDYSGTRKLRIDMLKNQCRWLEGVSFGDDVFMASITDERWDLLCHHGADVENYQSADFDVTRALANNTHNVAAVLRRLSDKGCVRCLITGSVFECDEGKGSAVLEAFSPYGLSKSLTGSVFRYWAQKIGLKLGRFVIPNPFGPYEEARFTSYLARSWLNGETPSINTPDYVRDNIHVSLLAKEYRLFAEGLEVANAKHSPSGYAGTQGDFALMLAQEMRPRLNVPCEIKLLRQEVFNEPKIRINIDIPAYEELNWDEEKAWDDLGEYYLANFSARPVS